MSKLQEYVEQVVRDGFMREAEGDENVMRSLPFFATALGLLATVLGLLHGSLCRPGRSVLSFMLLGAAACLGVCIALAVGFLLQAVRARTFRYPMAESTFVHYAATVAAAHRRADASEAAAVAEVRATRIQQLAEAAEANRRNNRDRAQARARALAALIAAIAFAFLLLALILARNLIAPGACHA